MRQGIVTIVTPIHRGRDQEVRDLLRDRIHKDRFRALTRLHFASFSVIDNHSDGDGDSPFEPHLVFEASFDGSREDFVDELVLLLGPLLDEIYAHCVGYPDHATTLPQPVKNYLHHHDCGADALYVATPGRTVDQITQERRLRQELHWRAERIRNNVPYAAIPPPTKRAIVQRLRREIAEVPDLQGTITVPERPFVVTYGAMLAETALRTIGALIFVGVLIYLRVLDLPKIVESITGYQLVGGRGKSVAILLAIAAVMRLIGVLRPSWNRFASVVTIGALILWFIPIPASDFVEAFIGGVIAISESLAKPTIYLLGFVIAWLIVAQLHEMVDAPDPSMPSWNSEHEERLRRLENRRAQNHMVGLNRIKRGPFRKITIRLVLWTIHLTKHLQKSGLLSGVSSIHFARWVIIDKGRQVLFLSHYDGDWDAYLGDFVTQASRGLTAVWSNCVGFPHAWFLFFGGASDERTFKAYARKHQHESLLVYSAYPDLTVNDIENHTAIREALGQSLEAVGVDDLLRRI
jgi:hypothetical protein